MQWKLEICSIDRNFLMFFQYIVSLIVGYKSSFILNFEPLLLKYCNWQIVTFWGTAWTSWDSTESALLCTKQAVVSLNDIRFCSFLIVPCADWLLYCFVLIDVTVYEEVHRSDGIWWKYLCYFLSRRQLWEEWNYHEGWGR